jgi:hypothetical protein
MADESPIFSKRQLVQSAGQFTVIVATSIGSHATANGGVTWNIIVAAVCQGVIAALAILGMSVLPVRTNGKS